MDPVDRDGLPSDQDLVDLTGDVAQIFKAHPRDLQEIAEALTTQTVAFVVID